MVFKLGLGFEFFVITTKSQAFSMLAFLKCNYLCSLILTLVTNNDSPTLLLASHILAMLTILFNCARNIPPIVRGFLVRSCVLVVLATSDVSGRLIALSSNELVGWVSP